MHNVFITGPAAAEKSQVGRLFAYARETVFVYSREPENILIDARAQANPPASALLLDECSHEALRNAQQQLASFVEAGGRLVVIATSFSAVPDALLTPLFKHGGLHDINMAVHDTGVQPTFDERFACAPQRVLASRSPDAS